MKHKPWNHHFLTDGSRTALGFPTCAVILAQAPLRLWPPPGEMKVCTDKQQCGLFSSRERQVELKGEEDSC